MALNKWHLFEFLLLGLFAVGLLFLHQLMLQANSFSGPLENEFKESTLRGAIYFALRDQGKIIQTMDFNFFGPNEISASKILTQSDLNLSTEQLCLALGELHREKGFGGGAVENTESILFLPEGMHGPLNFQVLCGKPSQVFRALQKNESPEFKPHHFSNCTCLKKPTQTCCVIALGKPRE